MRPGKLRIGVITQPPSGTPVQSECLEAIDETVKLLEGLGHEMVETRHPVSGDELRETTGRIVRTKIFEAIEDMVEARGTPLTKDAVEAATWVIHEAGGKTSGRDYASAIDSMHKLGRQMGEFMLDYDVLLSPTLAEPPIKLGAFNPQTIEGRAL
ncbi:MAG: amidase family protein, partial [Limisphaerales bacterium]